MIIKGSGLSVVLSVFCRMRIHRIVELEGHIAGEDYSVVTLSPAPHGDVRKWGNHEEIQGQWHQICPGFGTTATCTRFLFLQNLLPRKQAWEENGPAWPVGGPACSYLLTLFQRRKPRGRSRGFLQVTQLSILNV